MLERFLHCVHTSEEGRHDHCRHVLFRNSVIAQLELGQQARRQQQRYELVDYIGPYLARRNERRECDDQLNHRRRAFYDLQNYGQRENGEGGYSAEVQSIGVPLSPAIQPFSRWRSVRDLLLENLAALVDEEVANVCVSRVAGIGEREAKIHQWSSTRQPRGGSPSP